MLASSAVEASRRWSGAWILLALSLCTWQSGCVERRMTIRTNPPGAYGAQVYIDDYPIGTTPISVNYTYYGNRKIRLVKDGYETLTVLQPVRAPWYEIPPLDFFSENVFPGRIRDHRTFDFQMAPKMVVPSDQLVARGEQLRRSVHQSVQPVQTIGPSQYGAGGPEMIPRRADSPSAGVKNC